MINEGLLLKGDDYQINDKITIKHPTLNEIFRYGEENYFRAINLFCLKPYDLMVQLDDMGIDYASIDNYQLFTMLYDLEQYRIDMNWLLGKSINVKYMLDLKKIYLDETSKENKKIILDEVFRELNNTNQQYNFQKYINQQNNEIVLYDKDKDIIIDRLVYMQISEFLKRINYIPERNEFNPANGAAKKMILNEKRRELERLLKRNKPFESVLSHLISALVWSPNSKETINTVWDLHIYQFHDGIRRIQKHYEYNNTMRGLYAGTIDQSKIDLSKIDWTSKLTI